MGQILTLYKAPKIKCDQTFHCSVFHYPHYHYTFHLPVISGTCQVRGRGRSLKSRKLLDVPLGKAKEVRSCNDTFSLDPILTFLILLQF